MTDFAIAPTERPPITTLGQVSSLPERLGADILWSSKHGLAGVQRKEIMDLVSSVRDGRLGREFQQMASLKFRFLVIEGQPAWDREGNLMTQHTRWSLKQQWGVELSAQTQGVVVIHTRNAMETCAVVEYLATWCEKDEHVSSLLARPGPPKNGWGRFDDRNFAIHFLSGLPGISTTLAGRIFDHFGSVPIELTVGKKELESVPGIGLKKAHQILSIFPVYEPNEKWTPWLAGLIDGEGHISVENRNDRHYVLSVRIDNTSSELMDKILEVSRLGKVHTKKAAQPQHKDGYVWTVTSKDAGLVLTRVLPWLIIKRSQAEVALQLRETYQEFGQNAPLSEAMMEERHALYLKMIDLNKKGPRNEVAL